MNRFRVGTALPRLCPPYALPEPLFGGEALPPLANPPFGLKRCLEGL
jgi:hypothetical protein